jgi:hypothetical protein
MTSVLKIAALGAIVTLSVGAIVAPVMAQEGRLCLRFDNKSLVSEADEGQDAYDRAAALGNRCYANFPRLNRNIILPFPKSDTFNDADFYFLTREQRQLMGIGTVNPDDAN